MDHILIQRTPLRRLSAWIASIAIVADDDDHIETEFLPLTAQAPGVPVMLAQAAGTQPR